jgi:hypothetical protein
VPHDHLGRTVARHFIATWEAETSAPLRVLLSSALAGSAAAARVSEIFRTQLEPFLALKSQSPSTLTNPIRPSLRRCRTIVVFHCWPCA